MRFVEDPANEALRNRLPAEDEAINTISHSLLPTIPSKITHTCRSRMIVKKRVPFSKGYEPASYRQRSPKRKMLPQLPRLDDKAPQFLPTRKNYIVSNAVDVMLTTPSGTRNETFHYTDKADYGKIPAYLKIHNNNNTSDVAMKDVKDELPDDESNVQLKVLSEEDRANIIVRLQEAFDDVMKEYQSITHHNRPRNHAEATRKDLLENVMDKLQDHINYIRQPKNIMIDETK